ncbi:MAG: hypothetical protein KZQ83_12980 [gamma proteobacterium symbiont of Taylorina sp.]|nr:hypothetical protein [gamma proteobacterium symbiont of Taylorina sp.]
MSNNDVINFPEKSTIRSIEQIIKDNEEKKRQEQAEKGVHQIFNADVSHVINVAPGGSFTIVMELKEGKS